MTVEREFVDGNGNRFRAVMTIREAAIEKAILVLARKARSGPRQMATAACGLVEVIVHPVKP